FDNATLTVSGNISGTGGINMSGAGVVVLSGSNSFSGNIVSDAGTIDLRNAAAASTGSITLGDPDVDNLPASLAIGSAGLNISNEILTQRDLANNNNLRTIATSVAGNNALTGTITLNGGVVFSAVGGGTLTVTGLIKDGADTHGSAHHD